VLFDPIIEKAFANCPLPSEANNAAFEDYLLIMDILGKDLYELYKKLSPEHFRLVTGCLETLQMHTDLISHYYFQRGWIAAKEDNALDHF